MNMQDQIEKIVSREDLARFVDGMSTVGWGDAGTPTLLLP